MKKAIIIILALVVLGCGGWLVYDRVIMNPERLIVGEWQNDSANMLYYRFNDDGTMQGRVKILGLDTSIDGTYTIDRETSTLSITYKVTVLALSTTYDVNKTFVIDGDKLTLTEDGNVSTFTRVTEGANNQAETQASAA